MGAPVDAAGAAGVCASVLLAGLAAGVTAAPGIAEAGIGPVPILLERMGLVVTPAAGETGLT